MQFSSIPTDIRTGGQFIEFDASRAVSGLPVSPNRILIIAQKLPIGTAAALVPTPVFSRDQAVKAFGLGSPVDRMVRAVKAQDDLSPCTVIALDDLGAGVAATGTITFTSAASAAGIIALMIAGQKVPVGVGAGDAIAALAAKTAAAINIDLNLPVTAVAAAGVVTLTARNKGTTGNDIDVRINYYDGEALPAGVVINLGAVAGGVGNPGIVGALAAMGDGEFYRTVILGFNDPATMVLVEAELTARWGPMRQVDGFAFSAARGTQGALAAIGAARNHPFSSIIGAKASPSPAYEWAADYGAAVGASTAIDPARPLDTLPLKTVLAPAAADRFTRAERELLLRDGISTFTVDSGGQVLIERAVTTYQKNAFDLDDISWLDVTTPLTVAYLRLAVRSLIAVKFPRYKIADDGTRFGLGQKVTTPRLIRAELIALFREFEAIGLVENLDQFKTDIIVERSATARDRVNTLLPPNLVQALRVFAAAIQFRL